MTEPYYSDDVVTLYAGDCIDVMRSLPDCSVDAVVTDPPYGINFMGKAWDGDAIAAAAVSGVDHTTTRERSASMHAGSYDLSLSGNQAFGAWCRPWATEALRVLKPGGHLLAFGGTRTWHRLACAIEDAGFEVRDSIAWMYGSGFPKSLDVSKAIDKAAGAERVPSGAYTATQGDFIQRGQACPGHGDESSLSSTVIHSLPTAPATEAAQQWQGWGTALKPAFEPVVVARKPLIGTVAANVLEHGTGALNVDGCRIQSGDAPLRWETPRGGIWTTDATATATATNDDRGRWPANVILDESQAAELDRQSGVVPSSGIYSGDGLLRGDGGSGVDFGGTSRPGTMYGDTGGASRFFYTAKADSSERPRVDGVAHPTVKPLDLMRYLVRLVTPPGGVVLEPFAGSGTTLEACIVEGFRCIGIEREDDYIPLILQRITKPLEPVMF